VHVLWGLFRPCCWARLQQRWELHPGSVVEEPRQSSLCESRAGARRGSCRTAAGSAVLGCAAAALNSGTQHESSLYSQLNPSAVLRETISVSHCRKACCPLCLVTDTSIKWPRGRWRTGIVPWAAAWEARCKAEQTSPFSSFLPPTDLSCFSPPTDTS